MIFEGNEFNKTVSLGDQIVHCNGYINNAEIKNNRFYGRVKYSALCSSFSVMNDVKIHDNWFKVEEGSNGCIGLGSSYGTGQSVMPVRNIEIYKNVFEAGNNRISAIIAHSSIIGENIHIHDNLFYGNISGILLPSRSFNNSLINNNIYYVDSNSSNVHYFSNNINLTIRNETTYLLSNISVSSFTHSTFSNVNHLLVDNVKIDGTYSRYYGLRFLGNNTADVLNCDITGNISAVDIQGKGVVNIYNSILTRMTPSTELSSPSYGSIRTRNEAIANIYNCTLNDAENVSAIDTSQINLYWLLEVSNPLLAIVKIYDNQNNLISEFSGNNTLWAKELFQNASGKTNATPHRIEATKEGYENLTTEIIITLGMKRLCEDNDSDGYGSGEHMEGCTYPEEDCDDTNPNVHPSATEICTDFKDNDCDNQVDEGYVIIEAYINKVGKRNEPEMKKEPIVDMELRALDYSKGSCAQDNGKPKKNEEEMWNSCTAHQSCITDSNGTCTIEISQGHYIIIGKYAENSDSKYITSLLGKLNCGGQKHRTLKDLDR